MSNPLRCPACGETLASGGAFSATRRLVGEQFYTVTGTAEHHRLQLEVVDFMITGVVGGLTLSCGDCGHTWPTDRHYDIDSDMNNQGANL